MEECFDKYSWDQIAVCFNGGKDCVAMLHLAHAVYKKKHPDATDHLQMVYIGYDDPFAEVEKFIEETTERYGLDAIRLKMPMKEALKGMLQKREKIKVSKIVNRRLMLCFNIILKFVRPA